MDKSTKFWKGRVAPTTYKSYITAFGHFKRWLDEHGGALAGLTPDELVEYQKNTDNGTQYDILDLVQTWAQGLRTPDGRDWRLASKKGCYAAIRSFFSHNRAPLPRDPFTLRSDTPDSEGTLTIENIRDVALASKPVYRAVFLSMFQGALDLQGFIHWNMHGWEDLQQALRDPHVDTVKIRLPKRKRSRKPFHTFIGADAIKAIRDYLPTRPQDADEEAIFYSQYKTPLQKSTLQHYWLDRLTKLGLIKRRPGTGSQRYGKNLHELRDVWRSQWEKSPAKASIAEFCMGHMIDPLEYNKAYKDEEWTLEQYTLAQPMLEIMSTARPYGLVKVSPKQLAFQDELDEILDNPEIQEAFIKFLKSMGRGRSNQRL